MKKEISYTVNTSVIFLLTLSLSGFSIIMPEAYGADPVKQTVPADPAKKPGVVDPTKKPGVVDPTKKPVAIVPAKKAIVSEDKGEGNEESEEDSSGDGGSGFIFNLQGFIESENFINTYTEQNPGDINKKNEFRLNLNLQTGTDMFYLRFIPNCYMLPFLTYNEVSIYDDYRYEKKFKVSRNGRISDTNYEVSFNECYLSLDTQYIRLRTGNQIYRWGTADVFNPTSYINPSDSRELIFKDDDEAKIGVPSASAMIFIRDFSLELVYVPVHVPSISPISQNFWAYHYNEGFIPIEEGETEGLEITAENFGYGARLAGTVSGFDFALSGYYGPDREPLLRPMRTLLVPNTLPVLVMPEYYLIGIGGIDIAFSLGDFVFQAEAAYSPNKYGVVDQDYSEPIEDEMTWPFEVKKSGYFSYSTGFNYIWDTFVFTTEWTQSKYSDSSLMPSVYSDLLVARIEDSFFENFIKLSLSCVWDTKHKGFLLMPAMGFDFQNGLTFNLSYGYINGKDDSMDVFSMYNNYDIIIIGLRYAF